MNIKNREQRYKLNVQDKNSLIIDPLDDVEIITMNNVIISDIDNIKRDINKINPKIDSSELNDYVNRRKELFEGKSEFEVIKRKFDESNLDMISIEFDIGFLTYTFEKR